MSCSLIESNSYWLYNRFLDNGVTEDVVLAVVVGLRYVLSYIRDTSYHQFSRGSIGSGYIIFVALFLYYIRFGRDFGFYCKRFFRDNFYQRFDCHCRFLIEFGFCRSLSRSLSRRFCWAFSHQHCDWVHR
uniref:Uncharacterized protein n=1 Tax=Romanomermis culicivorax TaxID=13658 RepID=A0A915JVE3_ROMCU